MQSLRAIRILASFFGLTLVLLPVQWVLIKSGSRFARQLPHWYHRRLCSIVGVRVKTHGNLESDSAVLVVANHCSWLDIPVLSAVGPVSFVAKKEVAGWPFVGTLARLQRTVFVDRERRSTVKGTSTEIARRLAAGDHVVLFAEGTSSDGNRVLPFKSSLFAAVQHADGIGDAARSEPIRVQTLAVAYTRLHGLPLGRHGRHRVAWYGDMNLGSHAWQLLKSGPLEAHVSISDPVVMESFANRKALAQYTEIRIRDDFTSIVRHGSTPMPATKPQAGPAAPLEFEETPGREINRLDGTAPDN